jgi:hypothetical protein
MVIHIQPLLKMRPLLFGLSVFSLIWMIMLEARLPFERFGYVVRGLYYDQIFFSILLVLASLAFLMKRYWSLVPAVILSGFVFYNVLLRSFWYLAKAAAVPMFSYRHFSLWWPNLHHGQLLQIILSAAILVCSVVFLFRFKKDIHGANLR